MKKTILAVAFLATFLTSNAQDNKIVTFGAKGGLNISSVALEEGFNSDVSSKAGAHLGLFTNIRMGKKFAFQPEVLFSMQGAKQTIDFGSKIQEADTRVNYLSIPLNFQFKIVEKVFIEVGPYFDFLMSAKGDVVTKNNFSNDTSTIVENGKDLKDYYDSFTFGVSFGGGYHINKQFSVNARYYLGLPPAEKSDVFGSYESISTKNRLIQLGVGYTFN